MGKFFLKLHQKSIRLLDLQRAVKTGSLCVQNQILVGAAANERLKHGEGLEKLLILLPIFDGMFHGRAQTLAAGGQENRGDSDEFGVIVGDHVADHRLIPLSFHLIEQAVAVLPGIRRK